MDNQLYILAEVLLNYNPKPCIHFDKQFTPLYLTCKTFYNKYFTEKWQLFNCDICYFREIICKACKLFNTKSCIDCKCATCNISVNLTGGALNFKGICDRCPKPSIAVFRGNNYGYIPNFYATIMMQQMNEILAFQAELMMHRIIESTMHELTVIRKPIITHNWYEFENLRPQYNLKNIIQDNIENIQQNKKEEIVIKNIKIGNFKSTKYFENKKTKNIKNNYKHNGQQFRRQNQLKQPR